MPKALADPSPGLLPPGYAPSKIENAESVWFAMQTQAEISLRLRPTSFETKTDPSANDLVEARILLFFPRFGSFLRGPGSIGSGAFLCSASGLPRERGL